MFQIIWRTVFILACLLDIGYGIHMNGAETLSPLVIALMIYPAMWGIVIVLAQLVTGEWAWISFMRRFREAKVREDSYRAGLK